MQDMESEILRENEGQDRALRAFKTACKLESLINGSLRNLIF